MLFFKLFLYFFAPRNLKNKPFLSQKAERTKFWKIIKKKAFLEYNTMVLCVKSSLLLDNAVYNNFLFLKNNKSYIDINSLEAKIK